MTHRSGQHRIDRNELRRLQDELAPPMPSAPRAKPIVTAPREPKNSQHAEVLAVLGALAKNGWTIRAIARHLGVSHRYILDMRSAARPARTEAADWVSRMWSLLGDNVELPSSGTWG